MDKMTVGQIGEALGVAANTAKMRLYRMGIKPVEYLCGIGLYEPSVVEAIREARPKHRPKGAASPEAGRREEAEDG